MSGTRMPVAWLELRSAALSATRRGWPVVPGTFLGADRRWHGRGDAQALAPIQDSWQDTPVSDPGRAQEIWSQAPYGVLLVCGQGVSVLELPYRMIELLAALQSGHPVVPLGVTGSPPRFLVFTATDSDTLLPEFTLAGVRLHGAGAWVALPPSPTELVLIQRWWTKPAESQRQLRPAEQVQQVLLAALLRSGLGSGKVMMKRSNAARANPHHRAPLPVVGVGG
jgi:Bifunctional DNA primase/polymerase, N-terminal